MAKKNKTKHKPTTATYFLRIIVSALKSESKI